MIDCQLQVALPLPGYHERYGGARDEGGAWYAFLLTDSITFSYFFHLFSFSCVFVGHVVHLSNRAIRQVSCKEVAEWVNDFKYARPWTKKDWRFVEVTAQLLYFWGHSCRLMDLRGFVRFLGSFFFLSNG